MSDEIKTLGDLITELNHQLVVSRLSMSRVKPLVNLDGYDFEIESVDEIDHDSDHGCSVIRIHLSKE